MKLLAIILSAVFLLACSRSAPERLVVVVVPPIVSAGEDNQLAMEGLSALLLARLRGVPSLQVGIDPDGCAAPLQPTHSLQIDLQRTQRSHLIAARLIDCAAQHVEMEQWVQPSQSQRDWSPEAAYWVAARLRVPAPQWRQDVELSSAQMQEFLIAVAQIKRRRAEEVAQALVKLRRLVQQRPDFLHGQAHLAIASLLSYEFDLLPLDQALSESEAAIRLALAGDPDLALALAAEGLRQMNLGHYQQAALPLARAVALEPGDAAALLWLGNALLYDARPRDAISTLQRAALTDPDLVSVQISLGEAACLAASEQACQDFLARPDVTPIAGFMRSLLLAHRGEHEQALALLQQLPAGFNQSWRDELRADLCALLQQQECLHDSHGRLQTTRPRSRRWFESAAEQSERPAAPRIDVWRIDLGLSDYFPAALQDAELAQRLADEIERAGRGGLDTPLLSLTKACLSAAQAGQSSEAGSPSRWNPMLRSWGCAPE